MLSPYLLFLLLAVGGIAEAKENVGRMKRSPEQAGSNSNGGKHFPGYNGGYYNPGYNGGYNPGYNNGGYNLGYQHRPPYGGNGGQGYNPGYNNGGGGGQVCYQNYDCRRGQICSNGYCQYYG